METDDFEKPPVEAALNNHQGANGVDASHQMADTAVTPNSHPTTPSIENHSETTQPPDHVSGTATENDHQRAAGGGADGAISSHATVEESLVPVPPDGGFGWVIMVASFFCNVIVDGVCFRSGKVFNSCAISDFNSRECFSSGPTRVKILLPLRLQFRDLLPGVPRLLRREREQNVRRWVGAQRHVPFYG